MGDQTTAALIGAGSSALGGAVGLLTNSPHRQYKYQKKLMQLQNSMNQENATIAYNRSRQLTQDQAMLEKQGKLNAGINPAFGEHGNVTSAASAPQSGGVSIPTPPDVNASLNSFQSGINNAVNQLISAATARATVRKLNSEAEGIEIDNLTRNYRNMKEVGLLTAQIDKMTKETLHQSIVNKYADSREAAGSEEANARANIASMDASVRGAMNDIDYLNKVQDLQNKVATGELTKRQAAVELKRLSVMDSEISKNLASADLSYSNSEGVRLDNEIKRDTKEEAKDMLRSQSVKAWYDSLPHDMQQVIYSSKPVQNAVRKLQSGQDLSPADFSALGAAMGYENAGKLVGSLLQALSIKKRPSSSVQVSGRVNVRKK